MNKSITAIITTGIVLTLAQSVAWSSNSLVSVNPEPINTTTLPVQEIRQSTEIQSQLEDIKIVQNSDTQSSDKKLTSQMTINEKQLIIQNLMLKHGYSQNKINKTISNIRWKYVTDDFAPSFYTALEKGYLEKYIDSSELQSYFTNEKTMTDINNNIELMLKHGYNQYKIDRMTSYINWEKITDDLAPSFYTALKKGYLEKYIDTNDINEYFTDEKAMSDINKIIGLMLKYDYDEKTIHNTIDCINWKNITDDFAPSFYTALKKRYLEKYIATYLLNEYYTNEKAMSNITKTVELINKYNYDESEIQNLISHINWKNITDDFAPSFYTAMENGYLGQYIGIKTLNKYCTNEKAMSDINKIVGLMIKHDYNESKIHNTLDDKKWENVTDKYIEMAGKYKCFIEADTTYYKENEIYQKGVDELMTSNKAEEEKRIILKNYNEAPNKINVINLIYNSSELSNDEKEELVYSTIKNKTKYAEIVNNNKYTDKQKIKKLKKLKKNYERKEKIKDGLRKTAIVVTAPIWIVPAGIFFFLLVTSL